MPLLTGCGRTMIAQQSFDGMHVCNKPRLSDYLVRLVSLMQPNKPEQLAGSHVSRRGPFPFRPFNSPTAASREPHSDHFAFIINHINLPTRFTFYVSPFTSSYCQLAAKMLSTCAGC